MSEPRIWTCTALTDIWTGDAKTHQTKEATRLITTGLLGSIRWWFEVVVRGLGGSACDPTKTSCQDKKHCVVCQLFGCTGWGRKFRFAALGDDGAVRTLQITRGETFKLRFTPLRPIRDEEWILLDLTLRLITDYAALGGKTVYKPTNEKNRKSEQHHKDYGLVKIEQRPQLIGVARPRIPDYVASGGWSKTKLDSPWASLANFWCVNGLCLRRLEPKASDFNRVLGRKEDKSVKEKTGKRVVRWSDLLEIKSDGVAFWLSGRQQESKKVFSFKAPPRTFGFVKPGTIDFAGIKGRLRRAGVDLKDKEFLSGVEVLDGLLGTPTGAA